MFIWMQKSIEFHLLYFEIPKLPSNLSHLPSWILINFTFVGMSCTFPMIIDPDDNTECCHSDQTDFKKCKETGKCAFFIKSNKFATLYNVIIQTFKYVQFC